MSKNQFVLIELPSDMDSSKITTAKTLADLDKICTRYTDTIEDDLRKRLYVCQQEGSTWKAEPKIKRIYKYHLVTAEPKVTNNDKKKKKVVRSLKKDERVE